MSKKILLIVEGENDEKKFLNSLFKHCSKKTEYKIYSYRTNIHILAQELYSNYNDFDINGESELKLILASLEDDKTKKQLLLGKYSDIYMIFDFEPQHNYPHFDTVKRMIKYFNDSSNQGQLYINYPMMQSFKHHSVLPDECFKNLKIEFDDLKNYKTIVAQNSGFTDVTKYDYLIFYSLAVHHLKKLNKICYGNYEILGVEEYFLIDFANLYELVLNDLKLTNTIYVLNTSIFILIDFAPTKFFAFIDNHKEELLI